MAELKEQSRYSKWILTTSNFNEGATGTDKLEETLVHPIS